MMGRAMDADDIAYALHSIRTTGGTTRDADLLETVYGSEVREHLDAIRKGMATESVSDMLERMVCGTQSM